MKFSRKSKNDAAGSAAPPSTTAPSTTAPSSTAPSSTASSGASPTGADVPTASDSLAARPKPAAPTTEASNIQTSNTGTPPRTAESTTSRPAAGSAAAEKDHTPPKGAIDPDPTDDRTASTAGLTDKGRVKRTRVSALWIGGIVAAILAIFLLIFIAQNSDDVTIKFLGWEGQISLAVAMLLAAVVSVLIVAVPGSLRIGQLRRALRKNAKS